MGRAVTIEKTSGRPTDIQARRKARDLELLGKFGHKHDSSGYRGHPFFGYNCRDCGVHISLVRPTRWLEAERKGTFPGLALPEFKGLKAGVERLAREGK